jgi:hypothetical protein
MQSNITNTKAIVDSRVASKKVSILTSSNDCWNEGIETSSAPVVYKNTTNFHGSVMPIEFLNEFD